MSRRKLTRTLIRGLALCFIGFGIAIPIVFHELRAANSRAAMAANAIWQFYSFGLGFLLLFAWIVMPPGEDEDPLIGKGVWITAWVLGVLAAGWSVLCALPP